MKTATILIAIFLSMHAAGQSFQFTIGTPDTVSLVPEMTPFPTTYSGGRVQCLFLASELSAAGLTPFVASQLSFQYIENDTIAASYQLYVRIQNTAASDMAILDSSVFDANRNGQTAGLVISQGSFIIPLTTPFTWDGSSNVIVDLTFQRAPTPWPPGLAPRSYVDTGLAFPSTRYILDQGTSNGESFTEVFPASATKGSWNVRPVITWTLDSTSVGIDEISSNTPELYLLPNPANSIITVVAPVGSTHLEICNLSGRSVYAEPAAQETMMRVGVRELPKGVYLVMAKDQWGNTIAHKRLLIAR